MEALISKKKAVDQYIGICHLNFSSLELLDWPEHLRSDKSIYAANTYLKAHTSVTNV